MAACANRALAPKYEQFEAFRSRKPLENLCIALDDPVSRLAYWTRTSKSLYSLTALTNEYCPEFGIPLFNRIENRRSFISAFR